MDLRRWLLQVVAEDPAELEAIASEARVSSQWLSAWGRGRVEADGPVLSRIFVALNARPVRSRPAPRRPKSGRKPLQVDLF